MHDVSWSSPERWSRRLGYATFAGIELGLIGPFGSYPANLFTRVGYWIGLCWLGTLILWPAVSAAVARGRAGGLPPALAAASAMLIGCVPLAILAAAGCAMFWPVHATGVKALEWYGSTLLIAMPCMAAALWLERRLEDRPGNAQRRPSTPAVRDAREVVPPHQLAVALCLQMEDHHVRLHMRHRSVLHLASLRDTMAQAGDERGMQVHRSWWVARDAVAGWDEQGRSVVLRLTNGLSVPVARNRIARLREAGWIG